MTQITRSISYIDRKNERVDFQVPWKYSYPRTKKCIHCGKEFETVYVSRKLCDDCRAKPTTKFKARCEICGRHIRSGIPIDSEERALCSFCESDIKKAKREERDRKKHGRKMKPCSACGKLAYLDRWLKLCPECYFKTERPSVTKVEAIKEDG
jgi:NMD protein affecting ribosome stability and mRNA decay